MSAPIELCQHCRRSQARCEAASLDSEFPHDFEPAEFTAPAPLTPPRRAPVIEPPAPRPPPRVERPVKPRKPAVPRFQPIADQLPEGMVHAAGLAPLFGVSTTAVGQWIQRRWRNGFPEPAGKLDSGRTYYDPEAVRVWRDNYTPRLGAPPKAERLPRKTVDGQEFVYVKGTGWIPA